MSKMSKMNKDKKRTRRMVLGFSVLPLTVTLTFCGIYWYMWVEAHELNKFNENMFGPEEEVSVYDQCQLVDAKSAVSTFLGALGLSVSVQPEKADVTDTQWSVILAFNSILYMALSIATALLVIGAWYWPFLVAGTLGHFLGLFS